MTEDSPWWIASFDSDYLDRYAHRDDDEARLAVSLLLARGLAREGAAVLDLCCGAGRHLAPLEERGLRAFGVDYSSELLPVAARRGKAPVVRGDMRALPFRDAAFGAVIHMFTAYGYFEEDAVNRGVLGEVARVLGDGGGYALDVMSRASALAALDQPRERTLPDGTRIVEDRSFDPVRRRSEKRVEIRAPDRPPRRLFESVRVFERDELVDWLRGSGFEPVATFGDYDGSAHDPVRSPRLLVLSRRAPR